MSMRVTLLCDRKLLTSTIGRGSKTKHSFFEIISFITCVRNYPLAKLSGIPTCKEFSIISSEVR